MLFKLYQILWPCCNTTMCTIHAFQINNKRPIILIEAMRRDNYQRHELK